MKNIIVTFVLIIAWNINAQNNEFDQQVQKMTHEIDSIVQAKNKELQTAYNKINQRMVNKEITKAETQLLKEELLKQYADDLDYIIYKKTAKLKQYAKDKEIVRSVKVDKQKKDISYTIRIVKQKRKKHHDDNNTRYGTSSYFIVAMGVNNMIINDDPQTIDSSPYTVGSSRFFEMGLLWKAPVIKDKMFFRYGASIIWNTFRPKDKKIHEVINDTIQWVSTTYYMEDSKLRNIRLMLPLSVEINLPRQRYSHLRLSAGVYGAIRMLTKQKLQYEDNGNATDAVTKGNFNQSRFNYGLTGEIGGNWWSIYAKYDLLPAFKNSNLHQVSVGLKIEM